MELEFLRDVDPALQRLYLERAALQDRILETVTRTTPGWETEYEGLRQNLGQLDARITAEDGPELTAALNDLYLAVLEIQMVLFDPADPVPDLDREPMPKGPRSTVRLELTELSTVARHAASRIQSFAYVLQRG
jgi:hypothetical protein